MRRNWQHTPNSLWSCLVSTASRACWLSCLWWPLTAQAIAAPLGTAATALPPQQNKTLPTEILVQADRGPDDLSHQYFVALLKKALAKGADGRPLPKIRAVAEMEQGRAVRELQRGERLQLAWMGTDLSKEQQLRAIAIPLTRGLIGYRQALVYQPRASQFQQIRALTQLRKLTACQGLDWPDNHILQNAGLKVQTAPVFENLFKQLNAGRCDYFPRGLYEAQAELVNRAALYPNIKQATGWLLHYPFAVYFFTNKQQEPLALWIEQGLERMIDDGELLQHMRQHPLTAHVFPLTQYRTYRQFDLSNPAITPAHAANPRYFFQPADFKRKPAATKK